MDWGYYYNGTVEFSRALTEDEKQSIGELFINYPDYEFGDFDELTVRKNGKLLKFTNHYDEDFLTSKFDDLVNMVKDWPDIEIVDGAVEHCGDWEGEFFFENGKFIDCDKDKSAIRNASDDALLAELERRGITVRTKKRKATTPTRK